MSEHETDSATIERELAAIDEALATGAVSADVESIEHELEELALALRADSPEPDAGFAEELRCGRVDTGFPARPGSLREARRVREARHPRSAAASLRARKLLPVMAVAAGLLPIVVLALVAGGSPSGGGYDDAGGGGGGAALREPQPSLRTRSPAAAPSCARAGARPTASPPSPCRCRRMPASSQVGASAGSSGRSRSSSRCPWTRWRAWPTASRP